VIAAVIHSVVPEIPNPFTIHNVLDVSPQKKIRRGKIWASGRSEMLSALPSPGVREFLIQRFAHRLAKRRGYSDRQLSISSTYVLSPLFKTSVISIYLIVFEYKFL
jgi:hypothetical protein